MERFYLAGEDMDLYLAQTEWLRMQNESGSKDNPGQPELGLVGVHEKEFENAIRSSWPKVKDHTPEPVVLTASEYTGSFAELVRLLPVGKSTAKVELLDWDNLPPAGDTERLVQMRERLRNSLSSTINRARTHNNGTYTIEVGETCMPGGSIYVTAVITRVK